jgi:acylpyruvate hydrolase
MPCMKLVHYTADDGSEKFGVYSSGKATDLSPSYDGFAEMVADAPSLRRTRPGPGFPLDGSHLLPPAERGSKILCMAVNYQSHIEEMNSNKTQTPILFPKYFSSLTGPYSSIPLILSSKIMDYEGELAVVMGKQARNVRRDDAWDFVAGYTLLNDISARSLFRVPQGKGEMLDWFSCKANDRSTPLGPWIVTPDEAGRFGDLHIDTYLNGSKVQSGDTSDMVFDVPTIIEHASSRVTLDPGDVLSTGTPAGVGVARNRTLARGDVIRVEAEGVGYLENRIF